MHLSKTIFSLLIAGLVASQAVAQSFPGQIDEGLVGDWDCGETRLYITKLGSIEVLDEGYVAGKYDASDGVFAIQWDDGAREDWSYLVSGQEITLTTANDENTYSCKPRE